MGIRFPPRAKKGRKTAKVRKASGRNGRFDVHTRGDIQRAGPSADLHGAPFMGSDGSYPYGLIVDSAGNLYGALFQGGAYATDRSLSWIKPETRRYFTISKVERTAGTP